MLRVELGERAGAGRWRWRGTCGGRTVEGVSREPLLDACREFKRMGVHPRAMACLFREGREDWDLRTTVGHGAGVTVREDEREGPRFVRYREYGR